MDLKLMIQNGDAKGIAEFATKHRLTVKNGELIPIDDKSKQKLLDTSELHNQRQQARKIL